MKYIFFVIFFLGNSIKAEKAQDNISKIELLQGIWECVFVSSINEGTDEMIFKIIKDKNCLGLYYSKEYVSVSETMIGFQHSIKHNYIDDTENEMIYIDSLKDDGLYYTEIIDKNDIQTNGIISKLSCIIPVYYECDGYHLSICGGKLVEYSKISQLPFVALTKIYYCGKQDKRDYIQEYLGIKVVAITVPKSIVYSKSKKETTNFLNQGDVVMILEKKGDWLKVDYGGEQEGWIKKSAIEEERK